MNEVKFTNTRSFNLWIADVLVHTLSIDDVLVGLLS
jgi:hypothetical protein